MIKNKYVKNPNKLQSELKDLNKVHVVNNNLHKIKEGKLLDYTGEFEIIGEFSIADHFRQTHIKFININDYESHVNAIDHDYESEHPNCNGYFYIIDFPQFNLVKTS